jgi:hypothetical protein
MKTTGLTLLIGLMLTVGGGVATAGPYEDGSAAYELAARNDVIAAISHDAEKRVVRLHDTTVQIENAYPDDVGVDQASDLALPFLEIAVNTTGDPELDHERR